MKPQLDRAAARVGVPDAEDLVADFRVHAEFFFQLAPERVTRLLAGLDLAAGELPLQGKRLVAGALANQDLSALQDERGRDALEGTAAPRWFRRNPLHSCFSSRRPTSSAQCSTNLRSSAVKAAGKWLSMSISPTTCPRTKTGATISDLVSREQAR